MLPWLHKKVVKDSKDNDRCVGKVRGSIFKAVKFYDLTSLCIPPESNVCTNWNMAYLSVIFVRFIMFVNICYLKIYFIQLYLFRRVILCSHHNFYLINY